MARTRGLPIESIYDPQQRKPFDSRQLVTKREDLINPSIWVPQGMTQQMNYNGLITAVSNNSDKTHNGVYVLVDRTRITDENYSAYQSAVTSGEDTTDYFSMWLKLADLDEVVELQSEIEELRNTVENLEPSSASSILNFNEFSQFPTVGDPNTLYVALDQNASYLFVEGQYVCVGRGDASINDIEVIHGGYANIS